MKTTIGCAFESSGCREEVEEVEEEGGGGGVPISTQPNPWHP